jgi:hypothetical protein
MIGKTLGTMAAASALLGLLACSSEEAPEASGRSMTEVVNAPERANNQPPTIERISFSPEKPRQGEPLEATIKTSDPDKDGVRLKLEWSVNGRLVENATKTRLRTGDFKKGDKIELRVVATDGLLESAPSVARASIANRPPRLQGIGFASNDARVGDPILASPVASDPDGDPLRFRYLWYVNDRKTTQRDERFDTSELKRGDRVHVEVTADDRSDETDPVRSAQVVILNTPPKLAGVPTPRNLDGEFRYAFRASDPDGDKTLRYRLAKAPRGMTIDPISGEARWRPDQTQGGSHLVEVVVEDAYGDGSALSFDVTVQVGSTSVPAAPR